LGALSPAPRFGLASATLAIYALGLATEANMAKKTFRLFVSSPGDVEAERRRVDTVAQRLNAEFEEVASFEVIRWETSYYSAHDTFQKQIPEAAACDLVVAIFRARLGTQLPADFHKDPSGQVYPSGSAYEVLSAIEARKSGGDLPDVYVFRYPKPPFVELDDPAELQVKDQWEHLKAFFDLWFRTPSGQFIAAFQEFTSTDDFESKLEDCLRQWLLRRGVIATGPVWDRLVKGSPFRGLEPFDARYGEVFFGRSGAIEKGAKLLGEAAKPEARLLPFLLLIGASGSGKSSLLRAGLIPRLVRPGTILDIDLWRQALIVPSAEPLLALAEALFREDALGPELRQGDFPTKELLARQLAGDPDVAIAPVRAALKKAAAQRAMDLKQDEPRPARLALALDQVERLFTEAEPEAVEVFAQVIRALVTHGLAYVVAALRSDAYGRFQRIPSFLALKEQGAQLDLLPPSESDLEEIVTQPVAICHPPLAFEVKDGRSLAQVLVSDAEGGDVLALLQMTLQRLFDAEAGRGDGLLRFSDYPGLAAAVTQTAEAAVARLDEQARAAVPALLTALVRDVAPDPILGTPMPVVQPLDRAAFEKQSAPRAALVDAFVAARLLTQEATGPSVQVRPVHDSLLRIWPQAVTIISENAALIRVRHTLEPIVREWAEAKPAEKARHLEISPALLDGAQAMVARFGEDLPADMRDFVSGAVAADKARRAMERRRHQRVLFGTMAAAVIFAVLGGVAFWLLNIAQHQKLRAERDLAVAKQMINGLKETAQGLASITGVPAAMVRQLRETANVATETLAANEPGDKDLQRIRVAIHESITVKIVSGGQPASEPSAGDMDALRNRAETDAAEFDKLKSLAAGGQSIAEFSYATLYDPEFKLSKLVSPDANLALSWYMKAAQQGHSVAQYNVARMYQEGKFGIVQNFATAVVWYQKSAAGGFMYAQKNLAIMYRDGTGVAADRAHAVRLFQAAANQGESYSETEVGFAYESGSGGLTADQVQAVYWLQKGAAQGDLSAERNLGVHYRDGKGVAVDGKLALQWFQKAADAGDAFSEAEVGTAYMLGKIYPLDQAQAITWFQKSAAQGNSYAERRLGIAYRDGAGVPLDHATSLQWYERAAKQNDGYSEAEIGLAYETGTVYQQNAAEALKWFARAAGHGDALGQDRMGIAYYTGNGAERDLPKALSLFQQAAESGNSEAQVYLAIMYDQGLATAADPGKAVYWLQKAAAQGNIAGERNLGTHYRDGTGIAADPKVALQWLQKAADAGDAFSQGEVGSAYMSGKVYPLDQAQAIAWYQKAAAQDDAYSERQLGIAYRDGKGVPIDHATSLEWYERAAKQNDGYSEAEIGLAYENGTVYRRNPAEALKWFARAAEHGDSLGQERMGVAYLNGNGVARDLPKAFGLLQQAAQNGVAAAQFSLGLMYDQGLATAADPALALQWFQKAADNGNADAQNAVGMAYAKGRGIGQDYDQARLWLEKAKASGSTEAAANLRALP